MSVNYGTLTLTASNPAQTFTEPLTLAEVQTFLGVPVLSPVDSESDHLIEGMIVSARETAEIHQRRDLVRKQYDLSLDAFPACEIELRPHLVTVDLVRYKDSDGVTHTLTADTDYIVDTTKQPGLVMPPYGETWPSFTAWPSSAVLVRFTAGLSSTDPFWSDAGQRVLMGMKQLITFWHSERVPFKLGIGWAAEPPFAISMLLSTGAVPAAR